MSYCKTQRFNYYFSVFSMPFCLCLLWWSLWLFIILCIWTCLEIRQWFDFPLPDRKLDTLNKYVWKSHKLITGPIACGFHWRKCSLFPQMVVSVGFVFLQFDCIYIFLNFILTWELFPLVQNIDLILLNILPGAVFVVCLISTCRLVI